MRISPGQDERSRIDGLLSALHAMDKQVRAGAAADLAAIGSAAVDPLVAALRDPRWEVRYRAAEALGQIEDPRVCAALAGTLEDPRDHVRYMAAKGLGLRRCPGSVAGLCRALGDENEYVRRIAAGSLAAVGDPGVVSSLKDRLAEESTPSVRDAIVRACRSLEGSPPT
ncbi:MAG: HEAT repeat domain-containing protein [Methanomicrobiales archaeon]|nr:HEAT repeat domain-containing protein [Methanomicrobiales archaeon]